MPNHIQNILDVNAKSVEDLNYFLSAIEGENEEGQKKPIDFNKIVPECGDKDWYTWRLNHWGTKWNAYNTDLYRADTYACISFQTAWSGVPELIRKLTEMFPSLSFHYRYADEDVAYNCGEGYTDEDGKFVFTRAGGGSDAAFDLYIECWGEDRNSFVKGEYGWEYKWEE